MTDEHGSYCSGKKCNSPVAHRADRGPYCNQEVARRSNTDRIEKKIVLRAPRARVWRAIADAEEFGAWFRVKLEGRFAPGARVRGQDHLPGLRARDHGGDRRAHGARDGCSPTAGIPTPSTRRWTTRTSRRRWSSSASRRSPGGTALTVVESGFDRIPAARRAEAFRMNEGGWAEQLQNIERHVAALARRGRAQVARRGAGLRRARRRDAARAGRPALRGRARTRSRGSRDGSRRHAAGDHQAPRRPRRRRARPRQPGAGASASGSSTPRGSTRRAATSTGSRGSGTTRSSA